MKTHADHRKNNKDRKKKKKKKRSEYVDMSYSNKSKVNIKNIKTLYSIFSYTDKNTNYQDEEEENDKFANNILKRHARRNRKSLYYNNGKETILNKINYNNLSSFINNDTYNNCIREVLNDTDREIDLVFNSNIDLYHSDKNPSNDTPFFNNGKGVLKDKSIYDQRKESILNGGNRFSQILYFENVKGYKAFNSNSGKNCSIGSGIKDNIGRSIKRRSNSSRKGNRAVNETYKTDEERIWDALDYPFVGSGMRGKDKEKEKEGKLCKKSSVQENCSHNIFPQHSFFHFSDESLSNEYESDFGESFRKNSFEGTHKVQDSDMYPYFDILSLDSNSGRKKSAILHDFDQAKNENSKDIEFFPVDSWEKIDIIKLNEANHFNNVLSDCSEIKTSEDEKIDVIIKAGVNDKYYIHEEENLKEFNEFQVKSNVEISKEKEKENDENVFSSYVFLEQLNEDLLLSDLASGRRKGVDVHFYHDNLKDDKGINTKDYIPTVNIKEKDEEGKQKKGISISSEIYYNEKEYNSLPISTEEDHWKDHKLDAFFFENEAKDSLLLDPITDRKIKKKGMKMRSEAGLEAGWEKASIFFENFSKNVSVPSNRVSACPIRNNEIDEKKKNKKNKNNNNSSSYNNNSSSYNNNSSSYNNNSSSYNNNSSSYNNNSSRYNNNCSSYNNNSSSYNNNSSSYNNNSSSYNNNNTMNDVYKSNYDDVNLVNSTECALYNSKLCSPSSTFNHWDNCTNMMSYTPVNIAHNDVSFGSIGSEKMNLFHLNVNDVKEDYFEEVFLHEGEMNSDTVCTHDDLFSYEEKGVSSDIDINIGANISKETDTKGSLFSSEQTLFDDKMVINMDCLKKHMNDFFIFDHNQSIDSTNGLDKSMYDVNADKKKAANGKITPFTELTSLNDNFFFPSEGLKEEKDVFTSITGPFGQMQFQHSALDEGVGKREQFPHNVHDGAFKEGKQSDWHIEQQTDRHIEQQTDRHIELQTDRHIEQQTDRHIEQQTNPADVEIPLDEVHCSPTHSDVFSFLQEGEEVRMDGVVEEKKEMQMRFISRTNRNSIVMEKEKNDDEDIVKQSLQKGIECKDGTYMCLNNVDHYMKRKHTELGTDCESNAFLEIIEEIENISKDIIGNNMNDEIFLENETGNFSSCISIDAEKDNCNEERVLRDELRGTLYVNRCMSNSSSYQFKKTENASSNEIHLSDKRYDDIHLYFDHLNKLNRRSITGEADHSLDKDKKPNVEIHTVNKKQGSTTSKWEKIDKKTHVDGMIKMNNQVDYKNRSVNFDSFFLNQKKKTEEGRLHIKSNILPNEQELKFYESIYNILMNKEYIESFRVIEENADSNCRDIDIFNFQIYLKRVKNIMKRGFIDMYDYTDYTHILIDDIFYMNIKEFFLFNIYIVNINKCINRKNVLINNISNTHNFINDFYNKYEKVLTQDEFYKNISYSLYFLVFINLLVEMSYKLLCCVKKVNPNELLKRVISYIQEEKMMHVLIETYSYLYHIYEVLTKRTLDEKRKKKVIKIIRKSKSFKLVSKYIFKINNSCFHLLLFFLPLSVPPFKNKTNISEYLLNYFLKNINKIIFKYIKDENGSKAFHVERTHAQDGIVHLKKSYPRRENNTKEEVVYDGKRLTSEDGGTPTRVNYNNDSYLKEKGKGTKDYEINKCILKRQAKNELNKTDKRYTNKWEKFEQQPLLCKNIGNLLNKNIKGIIDNIVKNNKKNICLLKIKKLEQLFLYCFQQNNNEKPTNNLISVLTDIHINEKIEHIENILELYIKKNIYFYHTFFKRIIPIVNSITNIFEDLETLFSLYINYKIKKRKKLFYFYDPWLSNYDTFLSFTQLDAMKVADDHVHATLFPHQKEKCGKKKKKKKKGYSGKMQLEVAHEGVESGQTENENVERKEGKKEEEKEKDVDADKDDDEHVNEMLCQSTCEAEDFIGDFKTMDKNFVTNNIFHDIKNFYDIKNISHILSYVASEKNTHKSEYKYRSNLSENKLKEYYSYILKLCYDERYIKINTRALKCLFFNLYYS
ncbi:conserved Plasmodium protein, unknown function [Plasmodium malariae]|uniref:Uncharacterized protein n=1 Tax=Plasmodium malariae TaxID=5858 RepID=A0A1C3KAA1_PLAMA|nr:conserved Plasmodium protein, unknown function [Plasmodium malariae]